MELLLSTDTDPCQNLTKAMDGLSPCINSPRQTVIRIEAFVALAAALLFLQFIFGGCRRRSSHWFIQGAVWLSYTFSFPLIAYTVGQMASSPVKNGLYVLWTVLLFWVGGSTNSVTAYALQDNKQWKRYLFELFQYFFYSSLIIGQLQGYVTRYRLVPKEDAPEGVAAFIVILTSYVSMTNCVRVSSAWRVTDPSSSKLVADYTRDQIDHRGPRETFDPITLTGCKYPVIKSLRPALMGMGPTYTTKLSTDQFITVDTIWEQKFDDANGGGSRLKDVCLSLALSHLLKRRFYGMECAEANLPETRKFVLRGLLNLDDKAQNYTRAFQIIEVELGFLYDFFFTKYEVLAEMGILLFPMAIMKLFLLSMCGACLLGGSFIIKTHTPFIQVGTTTVDVTITIVIIGAICLIEVVQVILYLISDWAIVLLACSYTSGGYDGFFPSATSCLVRLNLSRTKFGRFLHRLNFFGYWQNKIGQSSIIEGCLHVNPKSMLDHSFEKYLADLWLSVKYPMKTFVAVPGLVKNEIVSFLQEHSKKGGILTNGKASLDRNANFGEFAWALPEDHSQTMVMLMWHIATEYCNIASSNERGSPYRDVATTLSRYCAYLMSFLPDLLPGNSTDTKFVNHAVLLEARSFLHGREPITKEILLGAIAKYRTNRSNRNTIDQASTSNNNNEDTGNSIFIKGLKLGRELENKGADHWKVLAEFWAETIIFIAPSDNAAAHMERLAQGGEFLTHIWALLNHAGILNREQHLAPQDDVVQP